LNTTGMVIFDSSYTSPAVTTTTDLFTGLIAGQVW